MLKDIFLSHTSKNKEFIFKVHDLIQSEKAGDRNLTSWIDDADIEIGGSIPGAVNNGLESCRYVAICMSPEYFDSNSSGWTDAEWHSVLFSDPDNRKKRIVPILIESCPKIPALLRQFRYLDFRTDVSFKRDFPKLIAMLKGEKMNVISHRSRLLPKDRGEEVGMLDAAPDVVEERAYTNLLPINELPEKIYKFPLAEDFLEKIEGRLTKSELKTRLIIHLSSQKSGDINIPKFRLVKKEVITFDPSFKRSAYEGVFKSEKELNSRDFILDENNRRVFISLLNMGIAEYLKSKRLVHDFSKSQRFYFPSFHGKSFKVKWKARKKLSTREVAKPVKDKENNLKFWLHQAAYISVQFLNNNFYLKIEPTRVITTDGKFGIISGPNVIKKISKWQSPENNMHILLHVRFWTATLSGNSRGFFSIPLGIQVLKVGAIPAFTKNEFGIAFDQKDLLGQLDNESEMITDLEMSEESEILKGAVLYDLNTSSKEEGEDAHE